MPGDDGTGGETDDTGEGEQGGDDGFEVIATLMFNKESGVYRLYHGDEPEAGGEEEGGEGGAAALVSSGAAGGEGGPGPGAGGEGGPGPGAGGEGGPGPGAGGEEGAGGGQAAGAADEGAAGGEEEGGEGETEHEDFDSIGAMMKGVMELAKNAESGEGDGFEAGFDEESGGGDDGGEPMPPMSKGKSRKIPPMRK